MKPSYRITQMGSYVMADLQKQAKEQARLSGKKIVNLTLGNPGFPVATQVQNKLAELCQDPENFRYACYRMLPEFERSISSYYQKRFGVNLVDCSMLPLLGAKDAVSHLPLALVNAGDEVLIPDPGFTYASDTKLADATPVGYLVDDFLADPRSILKKLTSKTKLIWMNFPSNPTGQMVDLNFYQEVVDLALEHDLIVVNDNPYVNITWDQVKAPSIMQIKGAEKVAIELMSLSKDYSLAGLRIGYAVGHPGMIAALSKLKNQVDAGMCLMHQKLAAFCLDQEGADWLKEWSEERNHFYQDNCDQLADFLEDKLGTKIKRPKGGLYLWFKVPDKFSDGKEYAEYVLKTHSILMVPGSVYGKAGECYVRASFASKFL